MPDVVATAWTAARSLLERPGARGRAIADTGLFTAAPPELAQHVQHPLWGRSALDGIETADRVAVIETWERTRETGTASVVVRLTEAGRPSVRLTLFDLRDVFGVYLGVTVPETEQAQAFTAPVEPADVRPRFGRLTKDSVAVFTDVDDATCQLLGWSREELLGRRSLEFVHPDDQDLAVAGWVELLASPGTSRRLRLRHVRKDGGYAWFEVTNDNRLDDPAHGCVSAEVLDIPTRWRPTRPCARASSCCTASPRRCPSASPSCPRTETSSTPTPGSRTCSGSRPTTSRTCWTP